MGKGIFTHYKERLIEIGGNNKCLYLKNIVRKSAYDIGRIFEGRDTKVAELLSFLRGERKCSLSLIDPSERRALLENLRVIKAEDEREPDDIFTDEEKRARQKVTRDKREKENRAIEQEIATLKALKREVEEIEKETGRYELYVGYPFVFGCIPQGVKKMLIKAPLMLFPVRIDIPDEDTVEIRLDETEKVQINHALIFAYAQAKRLNIDNLDLEFDDLSKFPSVRSVIDYLAQAHIKIDFTATKNVYSYTKFREPDERSGLAVRAAAVMGRFPLANSIYNDYTLLEKKNLTNDAVSELLAPRSVKRPRKVKRARRQIGTATSYLVKNTDYAQTRVVEQVGKSGNMVIYGPPGTGKSQTIVNIITDAIAKHKRVLVVSQKKAALDVVFNRLGVLNSKAMYLTDEGKEKQLFYERCLQAHQRDMIESLVDMEALDREYAELEHKIQAETAKLETIYNCMNETRPFGLSLSEMYTSSYMLSKSSGEYAVYLKMIEQPSLMAMSYKELKDALFVIRSKDLASLYYNFLQDKEKNPVIDYMKSDLDIRTLSEVKAQLAELQKGRKGLFNTAKYPYYRQVLAYYYEIREEKNLKDVVHMTCRFEHPGKVFTARAEEDIRRQLISTVRAIEQHVKEYDCLHRVLTPDGYLAVIDNILRGNTSYVRLVCDALENYISLRDIDQLLTSLDERMLTILNFAYTISRSYQNYKDIIDKFLIIRIYHEILQYEESCKNELGTMVDFTNITSRILKLKEQQLAVSNRICTGKISKEYDNLYEHAQNRKDYFYQISKKQKYWPIRKVMDVYSDFILALFPCWLLSPENVSSLLSLHKNMFDIVIFDEASQVFIENTIPAIYRGKSIVVAGDAKQLRPSTTFMKRYLGGDPETQEDYSVQAALEVDSLLDLAVSRYESSHLTYHYRSRYSELIEFSNHAFYGCNLQIAPNTSKNHASRPIERYKVKGKWVDRKNLAEAKKVVELVKEILATRRHDETIGIITFNSDQQAAIADMMDKEAARDSAFRAALLREYARKENGEDMSLFIKNLENVQGDERDIILFSIGYAENEQGKIYTNFGSLSAEGGENRLNVAITRAKTKIVVVTSVEPEELKVETSKYLGPKLLKQYLAYVRAVSDNDTDAAQSILHQLSEAETKPSIDTGLSSVEEQIKERLSREMEKYGYTVDTHLGNRKSRISLAIYDPRADRYLLGIELDKDAYASSDAILERDVYKPRFMESRGWVLMRVWCRDWWLSPQKVIRSIVSTLEKVKSGKL